MVQRRYGRSFRQKWIAEEDRVISCALFSRGASSALFRKEEIDVDGPTTSKQGGFTPPPGAPATNPRVLDNF